MPSSTPLVCVVVVAIGLAASTASAQVVCTTPDGRIHAGDRVPKGCAVQTKFRGLVDPGEGSPDPATSARGARQAEIRGEVAAIERELRATDARLAAVPDFDPAAYANDAPSWQAHDRDLATRDAAIERLRGRQSKLRWQLESLKRELTDLTAASR